MNNLSYSVLLLLAFAFVSDAHQLELTSEKRQFIAVPRVGRSSESAGDLDIVEPKVHSAAQSIPLNNKILNHIYSDLLKRQGYIPVPRVGRSLSGGLSDASRQQAALDFYANLLNSRYPAYPAYAENRFKRSPFAEADSVENVNDAFEPVIINDYNHNLITKRQFLPSPRTGNRFQSPDLDSKETLALNQLTSNSIDGSSSDSSSSSLSNLGSFLQEESNLVEPIDLRTMSKIIKWYQQNKNKQLLANALSEKRANAFSSRLGRSAPLTPRLGRSYWGEAANEDGSDSGEHNDRPYYDSPISNRIIRTALTPRIGKRSTNLAKTEEKVI